MEFLPTTLGTRPRLALEIRAEGVVAARAEDATGLLSAVSRGLLAEGVVTPGLKAGNIGDGLGGIGGRAAVVLAVKKALEAVVLKTREVTLVVPDAAVRVLLLDFDALPGKMLEALPVVRFRLKKLLPFDADDAAVSYQVMEMRKGMVRVVAVAMPRDVLAEYEGVVRAAGFEPGAVLPSTLAALAGLEEEAGPVLVVNAGRQGVTTAIVRDGVVLLHRSVDLRAMETRGVDVRVEGGADSRVAETQVLEARSEAPGFMAVLPLVDVEDSAGEWARQEPVGYGTDRLEAEAEMEASHAGPAIAIDPELRRAGDLMLARQMAGEQAVRGAMVEVAQAVSVAAAYFEDTLEIAPETVFSAGPMGAEALADVLQDAGVGPVPVREMVALKMLGPGAESAAAPGGLPRGWLAGVRGALAN
jgi:type IV pilus assembly protein PilM